MNKASIRNPLAILLLILPLGVTGCESLQSGDTSATATALAAKVEAELSGTPLPEAPTSDVPDQPSACANSSGFVEDVTVDDVVSMITGAIHVAT